MDERQAQGKGCKAAETEQQEHWRRIEAVLGFLQGLTLVSCASRASGTVAQRS